MVAEEGCGKARRQRDAEGPYKGLASVAISWGSSLLLYGARQQEEGKH